MQQKYEVIFDGLQENLLNIVKNFPRIYLQHK
jgi:hypothetical protein